MKKIYIKPTMVVVQVQATSLICESLTGVNSNVGLKNAGSSAGYEGEIRSKGNESYWGDMW